MTDTTGALPPAGWYPDPYGAPFERWWDGAQWTEHTNTPEPVAAAPVAAVPLVVEPQPQPEPEPAPYVPPALEEPPYVAPTYGDPAASIAADPFAGFASPAAYTPQVASPVAPEPAPAEPAPNEPAAYEPAPYEPVAYQPVAYEPPVTAQPAYEDPAFSAPMQGFDPSAQPVEPQPVQPQPTPGQPNPPSSFDFGFNALITGEAPSNQSLQAPAAAPGDGESGLFGSWAPEEYVEPPRNALATAGLTLGILSFLLSALAGLPGVILSVLGLRRAAQFDHEGEGPVGRGKSIAGLAVSVIGTATSVALIGFGMQLLGIGQPEATPDTGTDNPAAVDDSSLTLNGGIALEVGASGVIPLPGTETPAITFSATSITRNFECTAESPSAANGEFVAVAMEVITSADYLTAMDGGTPLRVNQSDWIGFIADEDGTQVANTDAGSSCISEAEQLPSELAAGETVTGVIVLDMSPEVASISWGPSGVTGLDPAITRWEWDIPV